VVDVYHGFEGVTEGLGRLLTRPVRDRTRRVEWSENKGRRSGGRRKVCSQVCARTLGGFLSNMGAERVPIQESGCGNFWRADDSKRRTGGCKVDEVAGGAVVDP
jgi:hypothetical protein